MTRVYIAGPMSGYPGHNFAAFNAWAAKLRETGYDVANPVDINPDATTPWNTYLKQDLSRVLQCDVVAVLPGWELSRGAKLEVEVAQAVGIATVPIAVLLRNEVSAV
jgi:hypothetical protein